MIAAFFLAFVAPVAAQTALLTPQVGTSIDELAEARSSEVQPGWPEGLLNPIEEAPPGAESFSYPFEVTVFGFEGRIVAFQMVLEAEAFEQRQGRAMVPPDCLVAFNGAARLMTYALTSADQPTTQMPGALIGLMTITMPDGSQALVRGDFGDEGCDVAAIYNSKQMQALLY